MKLKHALYVQALALLGASVVWLFWPGSFYSSMQLTPTDPGWLVFGRNTGVLLFGFFLVALFTARAAADNPLRRQLRLSFFLLHLVSLLMFTVAHFSPHGTIAIGMPLGLHAFFVLVFGYFQFFKPEA
jgi:hypothetical protein